MVNRKAGWGQGSYRADPVTEQARYEHPWSRAKSITLLVGMLVFSALLTWGGIHLISMTVVGR